VIEPGPLWALARARAAEARARGAMEPIATTSRVVDEAGAKFVVRVADSLARKDAARTARRARAGAFDPFLPHDEALFVAEVSASHLCLLNKFPVLDDHLLIVTRCFVDQEALLDLADFEALWACSPVGDGDEVLGFYNGGEAAGASQRHKHLQAVVLPLDRLVPRVPIEPLLSLEAAARRAPRLPFAHALARLDGAGPGDALELYRAMLAQLGVAAPGDARQRGPYNLLVTRRWMLVAPRSVERFREISINALGFAGALLVRTPEELELVARTGVLEVLRAVGVVDRSQPEP
jgi:sulfate adenylyltransferase (ADP) / ATP adenylyltransferase